MVKPALVLVPGSFCSSSYYEPVVAPLREAGVKLHLLDPPSYFAKKPGPPPTMNDDADYIAASLKPLIESGTDVVLVAHSYGGITASQCLAGLTARERRAEGLPGGVVRLAFLTAVVPALDGTLAGTMVGGVQVPLEPDPDGWLFFPDPAEAGRVCFSSIPAADRAPHVAALGRHSGPSFAGELSHAGYKDVPVSWFLCEDDLCIVGAVQEAAVRVIEGSWRESGRVGAGAEANVDVTRAKCGHFPMVSARGKLTAWMRGLVEKGGDE